MGVCDGLGVSDVGMNFLWVDRKRGIVLKWV